jgi:hypothetical protein
MKVIFGLWHMVGYAGTQTWSHTLASTMRRMGHQVAFYTGTRGAFAARMIGEGFPVYSHQSGDLPSADLAIVSQPRMFYTCRVCGDGATFEVEDAQLVMPRHRNLKTGKTCTGSLCKSVSRLPKAARSIYVYHGWLPHDHPLDDGTPYIAISKETAAKFKSITSRDVVATVRQPIDLDRFRALPSEARDKPRVLMLSTYPAGEQEVDRAVTEAGAVLWKSEYPGHHWDAQVLIGSVDIVAGTGRGVCEAISCERAAIVIGKFGCDGMVTPANIDALEEFNFSGRMTRSGLDNLSAAIADYKRDHAMPYRDMAARWEPSAIAKTILEAA